MISGFILPLKFVLSFDVSESFCVDMLKGVVYGLLILLPVSYTLARLFLAERFLELMHLPIDAFEAPNWTKSVIPTGRPVYGLCMSWRTLYLLRNTLTINYLAVY
jgi:hypothetical protein